MNYLLPVQVGAPDMAKFNLTNLNYLFDWLAFTNFYFLIYNQISSLFNKYNCTTTAPLIKDTGYNGSFYINNSILKQSNRKEINEFLGFYLAGLIAFDGYISITTQNRVILGITFNLKDQPLAEKLLNLLGKGFIAKRKTNCIELRFSEKKTIFKIVTLINGKFRTPKIDQLHKLIDWLNNKYSMAISKLPLDNSPLDENSWLTGFIEADGGFYIRFSLKQIICKFNLEQRMIYPKTKESYNEILEKISLFFNVKLHTRIRKNYKNSYYIIRVENQNSIKFLINYLDKHTLLSSKYLDYLN